MYLSWLTAGSRYGQAKPSKMLTGSVRTLSGTSHNNNTNQKIDTAIVDKEIEVLIEKLELLEKQKALAVKEQELEEMRNKSSSSCKLYVSHFQTSDVTLFIFVIF